MSNEIERKIISNFRNGQAVFVQEDFMEQEALPYRISCPRFALLPIRFNSEERCLGLLA